MNNNGLILLSVLFSALLVSSLRKPQFVALAIPVVTYKELISSGCSIDILKKRSQKARANGNLNPRQLALEAAPGEQFCIGICGHSTDVNVISGSECHLSSIERLALASAGRAEKAKAEAEAEAARRNVHQGRRGPTPTGNAAPQRPGYYPYVVSTGNNINLYGNSSMEDPSIQSGNGNTGGTKIVHNYYTPRTTKAAA
ncbi:hypothetical protein CONPUDRAFT_71988 [Coniophora puteana RWD-64-598 SS2]|uniref:Hydrophobin n=1 Tax=Coniophora puteana (strain RWD-64-598) TaxID=741705 RepID=A0A5M3MWA0_CONPW|nr:uncharacterized protein CONPUDRAFT_71988 [Coniophora puteana RWD-64-598 SS2]EIW83442.1 hypothetical protein CONPUDRAFT_71988 [Coniophora puteana RWD-64-598 SS2]